MGEHALDARLYDNPGAQSLLDQLPLTLEFSDYSRQEVVAEPPQPITMDDMPSGESAPTGTIGYYAPGGVLVLYYTDVGRFNGIVRLGHIDSDVSVLRDWQESRPVTIERVN
ncbi:MAG TPA: cyclophilin-like fold protein [Terrimesophilobacter sp.]|nr:cyclophilin-like fold protein [Terrimesophilobacter sp.]